VLTIVVASFVAAGLLLWIKFRLVSGMPRTAIAQPENSDAGGAEGAE
jgi:hypothetical protein